MVERELFKAIDLERRDNMAKKNRGRAINGGTMNTIIGKGSVMDGNFQIESSIRVDGVLKGELTCSGTVVVGPSGQVEANLKAKNVVVGGKVEGTLDVSERVHLESTSVLLGDVKTKLLVVEEEAVLKGNCESGEEVQVPQVGEKGVEPPRLEEKE